MNTSQTPETCALHDLLVTAKAVGDCTPARIGAKALEHHRAAGLGESSKRYKQARRIKCGICHTHLGNS
jgi:hypothetical protein